jgi:hypothetical protein
MPFFNTQENQLNGLKDFFAKLHAVKVNYKLPLKIMLLGFLPLL